MKTAVLGFGTVGVGVYEMLAGARGLEQGPVLVRSGKEDAPYKVSRMEAIVMMGQGAGRYPTASAVLRDLSGILCGERSMLSAGCVQGMVDNSGSIHCYYIRLPAALAGEIEAESSELDGPVARLVTKPMSVSSMHEAARRLRAQGAALFFAAIES